MPIKIQCICSCKRQIRLQCWNKQINNKGAVQQFHFDLPIMLWTIRHNKSGKCKISERPEECHTLPETRENSCRQGMQTRWIFSFLSYLAFYFFPLTAVGRPRRLSVSGLSILNEFFCLLYNLNRCHFRFCQDFLNLFRFFSIFTGNATCRSGRTMHADANYSSWMFFIFIITTIFIFRLRTAKYSPRISLPPVRCENNCPKISAVSRPKSLPVSEHGYYPGWSASHSAW